MTKSLTRRQALKTSVGSLAGAGAVLGGTATLADQPNMEQALGHLHTAHDYLRQATANKGGHRATAMRLISEAITETRKGIRAART